MTSGSGVSLAQNRQYTTKIESMLRVFAQAKRLNRFDAEDYHDHCLHSTVSTLEGYGIVFDRQWESIPCLRGRARVRCKRYWLTPSPENIARVHALLAKWRRG